jgi:hypothetical protein
MCPSNVLSVVTVRTVCRCLAAGPEVLSAAEAVGYAIDPKRHLSATPATPIEAVDGVGDRSTFLSMA